MSIKQGNKTIAGNGLGKANTGMDNLTSIGANIANWSSNVTNCITEIPQDIKLELNNGTLTLKAGSKVYVPNGVGVFDELIIQNDITITSTLVRTAVLVININTMGIGIYAESMTFSGNTAPSGKQYMQWYDTANNLVKQTNNSGSTWTSGFSLPFAMVTITSAGIQSIDQVFNGFGYIGSTIFALPGVKGLIPDGRNPDGSLKNTEAVVTTVKIMNMASYMVGRANAPLYLFSNGDIGGMDVDNKKWGNVAYLKDIPRIDYSCWYCAEDNLMHYFNGSFVESISQREFVGSFNVDSNNKITSFTPKTVFHALDYSDARLIEHQLTPAGAILAYAGSTAPSGFLICDGSAVSRTTYSALFAAIGTTYGAGDGNSTFNLPNAQEATIFATTDPNSRGKRTNGMLPNVAGRVGIGFGYGATSPSNPFYVTASNVQHWYPQGVSTTNESQIFFNLNRSNSAYSRGDSLVVPASLFIPNFIIKY